jgi:hypothetical protein
MCIGRFRHSDAKIKRHLRANWYFTVALPLRGVENILLRTVAKNRSRQNPIQALKHALATQYPRSGSIVLSIESIKTHHMYIYYNFQVRLIYCVGTGPVAIRDTATARPGDPRRSGRGPVNELWLMSSTFIAYNWLNLAGRAPGKRLDEMLRTLIEL